MRIIAYAAILACWAVLFVAAWIRTDGYQWDFKCYYHSVQVVEQGHNPYDPLKFYYPLSAAYVLKPICALGYDAAHRVWIVLKFVALIALMMLWKRVFLPRCEWLVLLVVGLLAFRAATMVDIKAGNVSVFEQLFLWAGLAFLVRSRFNAFAACVVAASLFKLLPALMLLLLLLPRFRSRANTIRLVAAFSALAAITWLPFLAHPGWVDGFVRALRSEAPPVVSNPAATAAVAGLTARAAAASSAVRWAGYGLLIAYYALLLTVSRRLIAWAWRTASIEHAIMVATLLYALIVPRLMLYSYMVVIVPVLAVVIPAAEKMRLGRHAFVAALCLSGLRILPGAGAFFDGLIPLLLLWGCWVVLLAAMRRGVLAEAH